MQRRLIATIIGIVIGAILLTGVVTFALASRAARERTRRDLVVQAGAVATEIKTEISNGRSAANLLRILRGPFNDENNQVLVVGPAGRLIDVGPPVRTAVLPAGLKAAALHPDQLLAGHVVSGTKGALVYAAAPYQAKVTLGARQGDANLTQVVLLTRQANNGLRQAFRWFVLAAAAVLVVAALVADRLARRITRPLKAAETVTRQIAAGDLNAQIPIPDHADPELESLARSINTMAESLARSKGLERQFLLSVSHELRTPLTSIRGFAEAIADGAAPDTIRAAGVIASEARRLERLVRDLLDLAKLDARRFSLDVRRVDLSEVVGDTAEGFRPAADDLGLQLRVEAGRLGSIGVTADPDRLAQVVANLVENALKYAGSEVSVSTAAADGYAVVSVGDDGPGIAAADLPMVFDPLFMSSRYPARQLGSGLGLAIVAELVGAMGGTVRAESPTAGSGGTRMVVTLRPWSDLRYATSSSA